ncbi:hypothetical protein ALO94_201211 [Pseudomonas syringae pv. spinaceae]|uniref:ABC transporter substrate-binding protein n=1 Tax=Pseudomonas syringae pv. spinaceae TaxID=264459 RepID=A0A0P9ZVQ5_PSESX|nr:hypothetical protein ALO94_201211 [Pseudomonas syringae pv. spinaceae]
MLIAAQTDGFLERPGAVGVQRDACLGKALGQCGYGFDLLVAAQHPALEFEVLKAVTLLRGFGQTHHCFWGQRFFMAEAEPVVVSLGFAAIGQVGLALIADIKQVAEHLDLIALLTFTEQGGNRHVQVLTEQIKQRGLQCGDCVNGDAQVEGLQASAA